MGPMYYIGLDVHKRTISYCVKDISGKIHAAGSDSRYTFRPGSLAEDSASSVDGSNGSHAVHRLDL